MNYTDAFRLIEADVLAWLQSDPIIGQLPGVLVEPGEVESALDMKVTQAIGLGADGKIGLGYLVLPIEDMMDDEPEVTFGALKLPLRVQFVENKILNAGPRGRKIPIRVIAAYAEKILKVYSAANLCTDAIPDKNAVTLFTPERDQNLRVCQINLHTYESDTAVFSSLSSPMFTVTDKNANPVTQFPAAGNYPYTVTVTADAGAQIYSTQDGTPPWPGQAANAETKFAGVLTTAALYAPALVIDAPCFLRLRAFDAARVSVGSKISSIVFQ